MKTVWKFELDVADGPQRKSLPEGAEILQVQAQEEELVFWAIVEPSAPLAERIFQVHGTGQPMESKAKRVYIGTVQTFGTFAWHVFELVWPKKMLSE